MKAFENTREISMFGFIKMAIWFIIAIFFFVLGLVTYKQTLAQINVEISSGTTDGSSDKFTAWILFGAFCCVPIIWQTIKFIASYTRKSAIQGSRHYTTTISSDSNYIYASTKTILFQKV